MFAKPTLKDIIDYFDVDIQLRPHRLLRCPFPDHEDSSPSFKYYPKTDTYNCFGCDRGGDSYYFALHYLQATGEDVSLKQVVRRFGEEMTSEEINYKRIQNFLADKEENLGMTLEDLNFRISSMCGEYIRSNPTQLQFVESIYKKLDLYVDQNDERPDHERNTQIYDKFLSLLQKKKRSLS